MIDISFISQEQTLFEGQAKMVVMDGKEGQLGVVKGHSPLLAILKPGPVRMITDDNEEVFSLMEVLRKFNQTTLLF